MNNRDFKREEQSLWLIRQWLHAWQDGVFSVTVGTDDFDIMRNIYDLRTIIGIINTQCCAGLGIPIDDLGPWDKRYPIKIN